jgi:AraC family transcriptional regulator of adaptative response/methylated-DNA-[protein]-cysteine methyltransferase
MSNALPDLQETPVTDYSRIEQTIRYLESHRREQPDLDTIAGEVGLSPHHFQRLFRRWAGISPKRFLQTLTAEHARDLLLQGTDVLDTALETGLSGPGRLHDLLVNATALSPGEMRAGGSGVSLHYAQVESPFGPALVAFTSRGVADLSFQENKSPAEAEQVLRDRWPRAELVHDPSKVNKGTRGLFGSGEQVPLDIRGTNFQIQVWRALLAIPEGKLVTYQDVARASGRPTAVRAAASAVAGNRIAWLIPCHRVLRKGGQMGGYRWGVTRKRAMIGWEATHPRSAGGRDAHALLHASGTA